MLFLCLFIFHSCQSRLITSGEKSHSPTISVSMNLWSWTSVDPLKAALQPFCFPSLPLSLNACITSDMPHFSNLYHCHLFSWAASGPVPRLCQENGSSINYLPLNMQTSPSSWASGPLYWDPGPSCLLLGLVRGCMCSLRALSLPSHVTSWVFPHSYIRRIMT